jgi:hypothetical protein
MRSYDFSVKSDMFALVFRLYNLIPSTRASHARLSLGNTLSLISTMTVDFPCAMARKRSAEDSVNDGVDTPSKRRSAQSTSSAHRQVER